MPRFYFHLNHGFKQLPDPDGVECTDDRAAITQGVRTVLEMLADDVRQGRIDLGWRMRIVDGDGREVKAFAFSEVFGNADFTKPPAPPLRQ